MRNKILLFLLSISTNLSFGQITILNSFNPTNLSSLCGIGYDPINAKVWVYGCSSDSISCFSTSGVLQFSIPAAGESANDVDIEIAPVPLSINGNNYPQGQLLFVNGETGVAEIYVLNNSNGTLLDSLSTKFGNSHVVGGSYHPARNTFFLVQDNVPSTALQNLITEIDPLNGDTLNIFQITNSFNVSFGDIEIGSNGNLFVVSSAEDSIAEFTPTGSLVQMHDLPTGINSPSGIALDCPNGEAWVANNNGVIYHLGGFPCGTTHISEYSTPSFQIINISPNPFQSTITFSIAQHHSEKINITLQNALGQVVKNMYTGISLAGDNKFSMDCTTLSEGIYYLEVSSPTQKEGKKIIKIN